MSASITSATGITVFGQAVITLTTQPNPYEVDGAVSWLSTDLRVFKLLVGGSLPHTSNVALTNGPNDFITRLIEKYNDPTLSRGEALRRSADAIVVAGGGEVYAQALPRAGRLEITHVHASPDGDAFFPAIDAGTWRLVTQSQHPAGPEDDVPFTFATYARTCSGRGSA